MEQNRRQQLRQTRWKDRELAERSADLSAARSNLQVAITEQAIRELFDRVEALESLIQSDKPISKVK